MTELLPERANDTAKEPSRENLKPRHCRIDLASARLTRFEIFKERSPSRLIIAFDEVERKPNFVA